MMNPIYGAFEVASAEDPQGGTRNICRQAVPQNPGSNAWTHRHNGWPIANLPSGSNFANYNISVLARVEEGGLGAVEALTLCGRMPIWSPAACERRRDLQCAVCVASRCEQRLYVAIALHDAAYGGFYVRRSTNGLLPRCVPVDGLAE